MFDIPQDALIGIVERASAAILEVYEGEIEVTDKDDASPLTQADLAAHEIIVAGLRQATPEIPVVSEESRLPAYAERQNWSQFWLVDPLDGTKEFVNRNGEFTVNIALIEQQQAVWGIVAVPVQQRIFIGDVRRQQAWLRKDGALQPIHGRGMTDGQQELVVVASRSHGGERLEGYLEQLAQVFPQLRRQPVGSSLKLCALACGGADCYPRLGPTSEWDIAAAHAVLRAAGGEVYTFEGEALAYNSKESMLNPEFVAVADAQFDWWQVSSDQPA